MQQKDVQLLWIDCFYILATMFSRFSHLLCSAHKCIMQQHGQESFISRAQIYKVIKMKRWWCEIDAMTTT